MKKLITIIFLMSAICSQAQTIVDVATGEYTIQYVKSDGTVWTNYMTSYDVSYAPTAIAGLTGITSADGGQYTSIFRKSDGTVYSTIGGQITSTAYPLDNTGAAFTCDKVYAMWRMGVAIKNGEVWYWSLAQSNPEDMLLQFGSLATSVPAPRKLIQPSGKTIVKIVHGAGLSPYTYAFMWGLASDGTLWQWDQTNTTPFQVTGKTGFPGTTWTGTVTDIGGNYDCRMVVTSTNQCWVWGSRAANYGGRSDWQNAAMDNIATNMTGAGIDFPLKQIASDYLSIQVIDNNNDKFGIGGNQVASLGTGYMAPSWRTNWNGASNAVYTYNYEPYNGNQGTWVQQPGKYLNIKTSTSFVFYSYGQDMAGNWYSWGRAKAQVLGNGFTWLSADQGTYPDWRTMPAPRLVTPLTATWTVDAAVNVTLARPPLANAGINQYLSAGTTSTTLYGSGSHQNQPTNATTVTMTNAWTRISGPNTPTITTPTSQNTTVTGMIAGTYVFRNTVTNSLTTTDYQQVSIVISPAPPNKRFVSGGGNDSNDGYTEITAWATIAKANSMSAGLASGDSVLFERGYTYTGSLVPGRNNLNYGAYGTGTMPVISAFTTLTGWTNLGSNIWEATPSTTLKNSVNIVTISDVVQIVGRTPNTGFYTYQTSTNTEVTSSTLTGSPSYVGAEVVIRKNAYILDRGKVTAQSGSLLTYLQGLSIGPVYGNATMNGQPNYGFFLQRFPGSLDVQGEWYYDTTTAKMKIYSTVNPSTLTIKASYIDTLVNLAARTNFTFTNLSFEGANRYAVYSFNGGNVLIRKCNFNNNTKTIAFHNVPDITIDSCSINNSLNSAIYAYNTATYRGTFTNNTINGVGQIMGLSAGLTDADSKGMYLLFDEATASNYLTIKNNIVKNTGLSGIQFNGSNVTVKHNYVDTFCNRLDDGGGIYTWTGSVSPVYLNRVIDSNIIVNAIGAPDGANGAIDVAGFYMDDLTANVSAFGNTIANIPGNAVQMNTPQTMTFINNIVYNASTLITVSKKAPYNIVNNTIKGNIFYQKTIDQFNFNHVNDNLTSPSTITITQSLQDIGNVDSNYISQLKTSGYTWYYSATGSGYTFPTPVNLATWRASYQHDENSILPPVTYTTSNSILQYNASNSPITYTHTGFSKIEPNGTVTNNTTIIPAWGSKVLIENGTLLTNRRFVSGSGNDSNDGLTEATAWATIGKVNSMLAGLSANDSVLFERGFTYTGGITVTRNNLIFGAYGTGNNPIISGLATISSWTDLGSNIWESAVMGAKATVDIVLVNGEQKAPGRWPNSSYITYTSSTGTSYSGAGLSGMLDYTGGELVARKERWIMDRQAITSNSGTTINVATSTSGYEGKNNAGLFVQKHVNTLDAQGEWVFSSSTGKFKMYSTSTPAQTKVCVLDTLFEVGLRTGITIDGIDFEGAGHAAIRSQDGSGLTVRNCTIRNSGQYGIFVRNSATVSITNNNVYDALGIAVFVNNPGLSGLTITNNNINRSGWIQGLGWRSTSSFASDDSYSGIIASSNSSTIQYNTIDSTGYKGINFNGSNVLLANNLISSYCIVKDDGGGIYTWSNNGNTVYTNRVVRDNIVLNSIGASTGTHSTGTESHGIYMDGAAMAVEIYGNTVVNGSAGDAGIFCNNTSDIRIRDNKIYNTSLGLRFNRFPSDPDLVRTMTVTSNQIVPTTSNFFYWNGSLNVPSVVTIQQDMRNMFTRIDSNYYSDVSADFDWYYHETDGGVFVDPASQSLATWKTTINDEVNSVNMSGSTKQIQYNATSSPVTFTHTGFSKIEPNGTVTNNSTVIPAWSSKILIDNGTLLTNRRFVSGSGNDNNDGYTEITAWATIGKVNSMLSGLASGDSVLFERGFTYTGGIIVSRSTINFDSYGTGTMPVISGLSTVTGWVDLGGNIWEAPVSGVSATVNLILRNNIPQQVGRYPNSDAANSGYLTLTAATSTSITGPALSSTTNWTGAEIAVRVNRWDIIRKTVTSHSAGVVGFSSMPTTPKVNFGYFFQRDSRTLDKDGEWWYDNANSKLRVYSTANPATHSYQIATVDDLFYSVYGSISISNIEFRGAGKRAIRFSGGANILITNCNIYNSGAEGITTNNSDHVTVDNCIVNVALGSGIRVACAFVGDKSLAVTNCTVDSICLIPGMEISDGVNGGHGILCTGGDNVTINNNNVTNTGYCGIQWQGNNVSVRYNYVDNFCSVRDDGSGIYTFEQGGSSLPTRTNRMLVSNIVRNGIGAVNGTDGGTSESALSGIYFDQGTRTVIADSNTVANINGNSFHGNSNADLTIRNNVFYGNTSTFSLQRFGDANLVRTITVTKNIMYPYRFRYRNLGINLPTLITKEADILAMGTIDSNYYYLRVGTDTSLTTVTTYADLSNYTETVNNFSYVTGTVGIETHSTRVNSTNIASELQYNATNAATTYTFTGYSKKDAFGNIYNNSVSIPAWSSKILIDNGTFTNNRRFVSGEGNDSNDGLTEATAWATIGKANSMSAGLSANDSILFKRGYTYTGSVIPGRDNLIYDAYGTGAKPIISGFANLTIWTDQGGGVWRCNVASASTSLIVVTIDGNLQRIGRYPNYNAANSGYLIHTAVPSGTSITGPTLSSTTNWTNAEVVIRKNHWIMDRCRITAHSAGTLTYTNPTGVINGPYTAKVNYGHFFQDDIRTLDQFGEWFLDKTTKDLSVYFGANPSGYTIKASVIDTVINMGAKNNISISNIEVEGANKIAVHNKYGNTISVTNCKVNNSYNGININQVYASVILTNDTVTNCLNIGLMGHSISSGTVNMSNNYLKNISHFTGMTGSGDRNGLALIHDGGNGTIEYNRLDSCGYIPLDFKGNNTDVRYNYITNYGFVKDDGGGIYSSSDGGSTIHSDRVVAYNILENGIGATDGTPNQGTPGSTYDTHGIYFDEGCNHVYAYGNTVKGMPYGHGIFLNFAKDIEMRDNNLHNVRTGFNLNRPGNDTLIRNIIFAKNVMVPNFCNVFYWNGSLNTPTTVTIEADMRAMFTRLDSNYYPTTPTKPFYYFHHLTNGGTFVDGPTLSLAQWKTHMGTENASVNIASGTNEIQYNATNAATTYTFTGYSKKDAFGNIYNNSVSIPAYSSKILIDNGTLTPSTGNSTRWRKFKN